MQSPQSDKGIQKIKKSALGRGLAALLPDTGDSETAADYFFCNIDLIQPNPFQPRTQFSAEEMEGLANSIREQGIIQPLIVRQTTVGYQLVAGERRLRASKIAGLPQVPIIVKDVTDRELLEISIVENVQRADLNPLEEADAYHNLMIEFKLTQEEVAERVGKSRPAVANFLRLRQLPVQIKETLLNNTISMGHARALLSADTPAQMSDAWRAVIAKQLSVRETEALIKQLKKEREQPQIPPEPTPDQYYYSSISEDLSRRFGTRVNIRHKGKKGKVTIEFYNDEDLNRLLELFNITEREESMSTTSPTKGEA